MLCIEKGRLRILQRRRYKKRSEILAALVSLISKCRLCAMACALRCVQRRGRYRWQAAAFVSRISACVERMQQERARSYYRQFVVNAKCLALMKKQKESFQSFDNITQILNQSKLSERGGDTSSCSKNSSITKTSYISSSPDPSSLKSSESTTIEHGNRSVTKQQQLQQLQARQQSAIRLEIIEDNIIETNISQEEDKGSFYEDLHDQLPKNSSKVKELKEKAGSSLKSNKKSSDATNSSNLSSRNSSKVKYVNLEVDDEEQKAAAENLNYIKSQKLSSEVVMQNLESQVDNDFINISRVDLGLSVQSAQVIPNRAKVKIDSNNKVYENVDDQVLQEIFGDCGERAPEDAQPENYQKMLQNQEDILKKLSSMEEELKSYKNVSSVLSKEAVTEEFFVDEPSIYELDASFQPPIVKYLDDKSAEGEKSKTVRMEEYYSADTQFDIEKIDGKTKEQILIFQPEKFFQERLRPRKNLLFGYKKVADILKLKLSELDNGSLLKTPSRQEDKASQLVFKNLLMVMTESYSADFESKFFVFTKDVLKLVQGFSILLVDEIYTQVIKQTTKNDNTRMFIALLQFFIIFIHHYRANDSFILAVLNHFVKLYYQRTTEEKVYLRAAVSRLIRLLKNPKVFAQQNIRLSFPPNYQLIALMNLKQIWVPVFFPTGSHFLIPVDSMQTVDDMKVQVLRKIGVNIERINPEFFCFFEIVNSKKTVKENMLKGSELVWKLLAIWENQRLMATAEADMPVFILMLKVRYQYQLHRADLVSVSFFFSQTYFDVFVGKIPMLDEHMVKVCALLQSMSQEAEVNARTLLPIAYLQGKSDLELQDTTARIKDEMAKISKDATVLEQKFMFLEQIRQYDTFMAIHVPVVLLRELDGAEQEDRVKMVIAMKPNKLIFLNSKLHQIFTVFQKDIELWALQGQKILQLQLQPSAITEAIEQYFYKNKVKVLIEQAVRKKSDHMVNSLLIESDQSENVVWYITQAAKLFKQAGSEEEDNLDEIMLK